MRAKFIIWWRIYCARPINIKNDPHQAKRNIPTIIPDSAMSGSVKGSINI